MRSTYYACMYEDGVDGLPVRERSGLTLAQARRLADRWEDRWEGRSSRVMREGTDGQLYELRTYRSRLPRDIQESLTAQGLAPAI